MSRIDRYFLDGMLGRHLRQQGPQPWELIRRRRDVHVKVRQMEFAELLVVADTGSCTDIRRRFCGCNVNNILVGEREETNEVLPDTKKYPASSNYPRTGADARQLAMHPHRLHGILDRGARGLPAHVAPTRE